MPMVHTDAQKIIIYRFVIYVKKEGSMKKNLVSVIIPTYNSQAYIGETIESVIAQTYTDWEIVIADDGSTDQTAQEVAKYQADYPNIHFIPLKHIGVPGSVRNEAVRHAKGEYIAFSR